MSGTLRFAGLIAIALAVGWALPGAALAADRYVDDSGNDGGGLNDCSVATAPCLTIAQGLAQAAAGERVLIGGGTYVQTTTLSIELDRSLIESDFNPPATTGDATISCPTCAGPTPTLQVHNVATGLGEIRGFALAGSGGAQGVLHLLGKASVEGNSFGTSGIAITVNDGSPVISANSFSAPSRGVQVNPNAEAVTVSQNTFTHVSYAAVEFLNATGTSKFTGNNVTLTPGTGVRIQDALAEVTGNQITSTTIAPGTAGVRIDETGTAPTTGATIDRNRIIGTGLDSSSIGVRVSDTAGTVTLDSNLIARHGFGLDISGVGGGDVTGTNLTLTDQREFDVSVSGAGASVTLNSSTVSEGGILLGGGGTCDIAGRFNNAEPGYPMTPDVCPLAGFATQVAPGFVDAPNGDYHLAAGSPLVDVGDPAAPAIGATDVEGDQRALDGNGDGVARRDVGADERPAVAVAIPSNAFQIGKLRRRTLPVTVPGPGTVRVDDGSKPASGAAAAARARLKTVTVTAPAAGPVDVLLKLTRSAKRKLRQKGKVRASARVTFTPSGGQSASQTASLLIRGKRKAS